MSFKLEVYTDGGARGNPGPAAIAFIIRQEGKIIHQDAEAIGEATNNVAEYTAVLKALSWLKNDSKLLITNYQLPITFYIDSKLVVEQLSGRYKIKNQNLKSLAEKIKTLERDLALKVDYYNISRSQNQQADFLLNRALDAFCGPNFKIGSRLT